jgi:hypothetical protein
MRNQHILLGRGRSVIKNDIFKALQYQNQLNKNGQGAPQKKNYGGMIRAEHNKQIKPLKFKM